MNGLPLATGCAAVAGAAAIGAYVGLVTGRVTLDLGIGRRTRPLGPFDLDIAAPPRDRLRRRSRAVRRPTATGHAG